MSDQRRSDDPDAQRLPSDDRALANVLRRQEKKIAKLERNQIGCNMQCTPTVVTNKPPANPQCGVCYILYGSEGCTDAPPGCDDCRECLPDVMGSPRWEGGTPSGASDGPHGPLLYEPTDSFYYAGDPRVQISIWPDPFTGNQSISCTAKNFGVAHGLVESQADYVALELRRHDGFVYGDGLRVVIEAWAAGTDFFGNPIVPGWYWWVEWFNEPLADGTGDYIYEYYCDDDPSFDGSVIPWRIGIDDFERADGPLGADWTMGAGPGWATAVAPLAIDDGAAVGPVGWAPPGDYVVNAAQWATPLDAAETMGIGVTVEGLGSGTVPSQAVSLMTRAGVGKSSQCAIFDFGSASSLRITLIHFLDDGSYAASPHIDIDRPGEPMDLALESDPDGTLRVLVNNQAVWTEVDATAIDGTYVGFSLEHAGVSPRVLEARIGSDGVNIRLESGEDGTFSWSLNGEVQHEGSVAPGAYLTDPTKVGVWTDMVTSGIGVIEPTIEITTHVHDICINGSEDSGGASGGGFCDTFDRADGSLGSDYSASPLTIVGGRVAIPEGGDVNNYTRVQREITGSQSIEVSFSITGIADLRVWLICAMPTDGFGIGAYMRLFFSPFFVDDDGNTHMENDTIQAIGLWYAGSFSGPYWGFYPETSSLGLVTPTSTLKMEVTADHMATFSYNGSVLMSGSATGGPTGSDPLGPHIGFDIREAGGDDTGPGENPYLESVCITGDGAGGEGGAGTCGDTPTAATWLSGGGNSYAWLRGGPPLRPKMRRERVRG